MEPTNALVTALLTDLYQITMTYAHWKNGKHEEDAVFELFFRKNPFKGQFTIFCGSDEVTRFLQSFKFTPDDIDYLRSVPSLSHCEEGFFDYLLQLDTAQLTVRAMKEGSVAFPRIPLIIIEGPLGLGQLVETTLLNLVNYPSLIATNASRMSLRAGPGKTCVEFGLRRAQGPDGACSASKYSYVGGFVATSNVQAGKKFGIPIAGTHAHAFVQSFVSLDEVQETTVINKGSGKSERILPKVLEYRDADVAGTETNVDAAEATTGTNDGELAAFVAYAGAFPDTFLCLIDTYDTLRSGLRNFIYVAKVLDDFGYRPKGIRLDSGDLRELSLRCEEAFEEVAKTRQSFGSLSIVASNDINESVLQDLTTKDHGITTFGIGTNLVTCQAQPALGCVYKLVEWKGQPRIKISQDLPKVTIPGRKRAYRLHGANGSPLVDYMALASEGAPEVGRKLVCRDPFHSTKRVAITPSRVVPLHHPIIELGKVVEEHRPPLDLSKTRQFAQEQLQTFPDSMKAYDNPTAYPVMASQSLFKFLHDTWESEAPVPEWK